MTDIKPSQKAIDNLRTLRDEIRVKMHLGEMDARAWWTDVETKLADVEHQLERGLGRAGNYVDIFVDELTRALRRVNERIEDKHKS